MNYISIEDITFAYPGGNRPVLENLSLTIERGEFVVLAGKNGSGKSTLLRQLNGLLLPQTGKILIDNLDTSHKKNKSPIHHRAGMVFQEPENQITGTIVREDVAFGPENLAMEWNEMEEAITRALDLTGLTDLIDRPTSALSSGQKQRLALAGILAMSPQCLLLDEPTSMLNPLARHKFRKLLQELHREQGLTIVMVSHDIREILGAPRMIILDQGKVVKDGSPLKILKEENIQKWGLVPPKALQISRFLSLRAEFPSVLTEKELIFHLKKKENRDLKDYLFSSYPLVDWKRDKSKKKLLNLSHVSHHYLKGTVLKTRALHQISFDLVEGETAFLIGNTGSGKTTLLQHLNGLLLPEGGDVSLLGIDPRREKNKTATMKRIRSSIGLVMQQPEKQIFERYVGDDVAFAPKLLGLKGRQLSLRVKWAMELCGLDFKEFKDRPTYALSGGEKRKVALAGVIAMEPKVLLLDEPSSGLDPLSKEDLYKILQNLQKQSISMVISTHDMEEAVLLADRVYLMDKGEIVKAGTPMGVFSYKEELEKRGLELPFIKRIEEGL